MKKLWVVLLTVLLLISFVSCSDDKAAQLKEQYEAELQVQKDEQEAMIKNFEDFMKAYKEDYNDLQTLWNCYETNGIGNILDGSDINLTLSESKYPGITAKILENKGFINLLEDGQDYKGGGMYAKDDPAPSGTVTGKATRSPKNYNLTITENKFTVPYEIYNTSDDTQVAVKSGDLEVTIDGTYKEETTEEKHTVEYDITIIDQRYQLSYTYDKTTKKVTSASVNGKSVEIRLFNAEGVSLVE